MQIYLCDTSAYTANVRRGKLVMQGLNLGDDVLAHLNDNGFFSLPLREGDYPGSLFDFAYSVGYALETLTIFNDLQWERTSSPFIVGMFGTLKKLGFKFFPPAYVGCEEALVNQGFSAPVESRYMVPLENQIFAYTAFTLTFAEWENKQGA